MNYAGTLLFASALSIHVVCAQTTIRVNTAASTRKPISPYIYGTNQILNSADKYQSYRIGGNRLSGYNWETNASNAGSDYLHQSDDYLCTLYGASNCGAASNVLQGFRTQASSNGIPYTLATLQMAGYVSADKSGPVNTNQVAPSSRWKVVQALKGSVLSTTPSTTDGNVYMDEFVNFCKSTYGAASADGINGYFLDNEPGLWSATHSRMHPARVGCVELVNKSINTAKAVKSVDASADVYGHVAYGFAELEDLQSAPDWNSVKGSYSRFTDYFLAQMKQASNTYGSRLLDVYDIHWYPEARGTTSGKRITFDGATDDNTNEARLQAPRVLWDSSYDEVSWIQQSFSSRYPLITKLNASINAQYPGTKLSFSEYNYGGENHWSGGLAHADVLGVFGQQGVYAAQFWRLEGGAGNYVSAAFRLYNNYNGSGAKFGNTSVSANSNDKAKLSVYASINNANQNTLYLIVINKAATTTSTSISLTSDANYSSVAAWGFDQSSSSIGTRTGVSNIGGDNLFTYSFPARSATILVLSAGGSQPVGSAKIYQDALATNWSDYSFSTTVNFNSTTRVKNGTKSISAQYTGGFGGLSLRRSSALNTSGITSIRFWAYGASGGSRVRVYTQPSDAGAESTPKSLTLAAGGWTQYTVPLNQLGNPANIQRITIQNATSGTQSVYYIDDLELVGASGARVGSETIDAVGLLHISPNPATDHATIQYTAQQTQAATVEVLDLTGRVVQQRNVQLIEGQNRIDVPLLGIPAGMLLLRLNADGQVRSGKLLINH
jgi:Glycoside hydrolase family 44/Secretion system C-terminal sorting domain